MGSFFVPLRKLTIKGTTKKTTIKTKVEGCQKCGLDYKNKVPPTIGDNYSGLMIIGDRIGKKEWEKKKNFVERTGEILRSTSLHNRVNLGKEAILTNATVCLYGKHKDIYPKCCRENLFKVIQQYKPKLIITLGEIATNSVLNTDTKFRISRLRNHFIPCHEHNCLVYPTFNPAALLYRDYDDDEEDEYGNKNTYKSAKPKEYTFQKDMERVLKFWKDKGHNRRTIDRILKERNILENIEIKEIKTKKELDEVVKLIRKVGRFSFDYETSNTKPYDDNFKVWLWSFGIEGKEFAAYKDHFEDLDYLREITLDLLHDLKIHKIIQNKKFEELVSRWDLKELIEELGLEKPIIRNAFCTMISAKTFDGRKGTTSLDFQNLVKFGIKPYSKKVDKYIKTKKKDDSITNNIHLCDPDELVKYGCLDVRTTYAQEEPNKLLLQESEKFNYCYNLLFEGAEAFADIEEEGFPIDENILDELEEFFTEEKEQRFEKLLSSSDVIKFFLKRGIKKTKESFDTFLRSPKQLQDFFFKFLKLKPLKQTKTGDSTDVEVITYLALQGSTFCETLIDIRKLNKAMDYVKQFRKYLNKDGKIHCSINYVPETYRSSILDPALQTIPKHGNIIEGVPYTVLRKPFRVKDLANFILLQVDYSGFELFVGAGLSQDPKFIKDVNETDIHAREAVRVFELDCDPSEVKKLTFTFDGKEFSGAKDLRFHTKNACNFATVYGASYFSIAQNLRNLECFIAFAKDKYKKSKSSLDFSDWFVSWSEEHIKYWQEEQFFKDYPRLQQWQNEEVKDYYRKGYVEYPMGFRRYHPLDRNQIINSPTQGVAFITLLDSCIKVNKEIKKQAKEIGLRSRIILETHDDMCFHTYKPEIYELSQMVNKITLNPPFEFYETLKLKNEWSCGYDLYSMKEVNL